MAIPSGSGTEVIKTAVLHEQSSSQSDLFGSTVGAVLTPVPANHIYIVLSVSFVEMGNAAEQVYMRVNDGTNDIYLLNAESIPANATFVWNDKFAVSAGHSLRIAGEGTTNIDVYCTYIAQNWS